MEKEINMIDATDTVKVETRFLGSEILAANLILDKLKYDDYTPMIAVKDIINYYKNIKDYIREKNNIELIVPQTDCIETHLVLSYPLYFIYYVDDVEKRYISITDDCNIEELRKTFESYLPTWLADAFIALNNTENKKESK